MKNIKITLAVLVCAAALTACCAGGKKGNASANVQPSETTAAPADRDALVRETRLKMNTCKKAEDCVAVFPTCCGVSYRPFFVNKKYKEEFTSEFRRIHELGDCSAIHACPMVYFGGLTQADCLDGRCTLAGVPDYMK